MKQFSGTVTSTKMQNTVVVKVDTFKFHPLYKKRVKASKKYLVHRGKSKVKLGDSVTIRAAKPISKRKRWQLVKL